MVKNGGHNFFVWIIYWKWIWHHIYWRYNWFHNSRGIFPVLNLSKIYFGLLFFPNQFIENGRCGIRENMREAFFVSRYFIEGRFGFLIQCWWRVFIGKYLFFQKRVVYTSGGKHYLVWSGLLKTNLGYSVKGVSCGRRAKNRTELFSSDNVLSNNNLALTVERYMWQYIEGHSVFIISI